MIGKLRGVVDSVYDGYIILDVNSVGYVVHCSNNSLSKLRVGAIAELVVQTQVREDDIKLYGFFDVEEKDIFLMLISVKGVGAKVALGILSSLSSDRIKQALVCADILAFNNVPGIGKKTAERIITELKYKISDKLSGHGAYNMLLNESNRTIFEDAVLALGKLGISATDARKRVNKVLGKSSVDISVDRVIKLSLLEQDT